MVVVKLIKAEETYTIRKEELRKNMTLSERLMNDFKEDTFHYGLFKDDEIVSVVSFMKADYPEFAGVQYQLRGMATKEVSQGKGFGKILVQKSLEQLSNLKVDFVWCHARVAALGFYAKQGFRVTGKEFDVPQVGGHFIMYKKINNLL